MEFALSCTYSMLYIGQAHRCVHDQMQREREDRKTKKERDRVGEIGGNALTISPWNG